MGSARQRHTCLEISDKYAADQMHAGTPAESGPPLQAAPPLPSPCSSFPPMATVKLATLAIRTIAKPISAQLKNQAKQHETFRNICVSLAQKMHTAEISLRTNILGEPARQHIRPLSETKAIENGANALAESFLFGVAALLIVGESYRSSSKQSRYRDDVDDKLEGLLVAVEKLQQDKAEVEGALERTRDEVEGERNRREALEKVVEQLVGVGLSAGGDPSLWQGTPLNLARVEIVRASDVPRSSDDRSPKSSSKS